MSQLKGSSSYILFFRGISGNILIRHMTASTDKSAVDQATKWMLGKRMKDGELTKPGEIVMRDRMTIYHRLKKFGKGVNESSSDVA